MFDMHKGVFVIFCKLDSSIKFFNSHECHFHKSVGLSDFPFGYHIVFTIFSVCFFHILWDSLSYSVR